MKPIFLSFLSLLLLTGCMTDTPSVELPEESDSPTISSTGIIRDIDSEDYITDDSTLDTSSDEADNTVAAYNLSTLEINANGTEPFWNFAASGNNLVFREPSQSGPMLQTTYNITMSQNGNQIIISDGSSIIATLELQTCSDGMSDVPYTHSVQIQHSGDIWYGCANTNQ